MDDQELDLDVLVELVALYWLILLYSSISSWIQALLCLDTAYVQHTCQHVQLFHTTWAHQERISHKPKAHQTAQCCTAPSPQ